ncbi:sporulation protein YhbH [Bacillus taeanensis]|uniref:Sporulation protein YhbH n=1 Tax=Bacillus taeanensis TaxID=273032 RepID=A0A366XU27_9BACI|nr:sporulation protein YhbH [Bacillus taeanensis]RBW69642.1 sporulation protein YhbH [Bacillus taeanensis]
MEMKPLFILSRDDWSLHRKGDIDQKRHKQKIKDAIKRNLADIVSEESIIMSSNSEKIKVPIRSIKQYKFRFSSDDQQRVGQGNGDSNVGDVLGQSEKGEAQQGKGEKPGDLAGEDYYEAEVSMDEIAELIFEDLQLPNLKEKQKSELTHEEISFNDIRKQGIIGNIDKRRTIFETIKRQSRHKTQNTGLQITKDDLRFKTWEIQEKPTTNAVVLAMMDTSASMGTFEKYIARSFFFWMVRFLRTNYQKVEIVFLAHDAEAKEVSEEHFFTKGESGGTKCSSVYKLANEIIDSRYPQEAYNNYAFHFSDGDNWYADNEKTIQFVKELIKKCNMTGYGEINPFNRSSKLSAEMNKITDPSFITSSIREKSDVYSALKSFFGDKMKAASQ